MPRNLFPARLLLYAFVTTSCTTITPSLPQHIDLLQQYTVHSTRVDGHRITYLDIGQGSPIILLHGFGGSMWHWEHQQQALSRNHRVITIDMLGSGLSDKPTIDYTPTFLLHVLEQFMSNLGISNATLVGNSLGAGLALGLAISFPEKVDKLILISGFPAKVIENLDSPSYRRFVEHPPPVWLAKVGNWVAGRWATERLLKEIIYNHDLISPVVVERSYRNRSDLGFLHPLYSLASHLKEWETHLAPRLAHITQPTLIVWGAQDQIFSPRVGNGLKKLLRHSTMQEIPEAGHLPQWEKADVVNRIILQFLGAN